MIKKLEAINKCKKNICDIDKIINICENNIHIQNKQMLKQLKAKRNKNIIELYNLTKSNYTFDNVIKISEMKLDYKNRTAFITYNMTDGSKNKQLYPVDKLLIKNKVGANIAFD